MSTVEQKETKSKADLTTEDICREFLKWKDVEQTARALGTKLRRVRNAIKELLGDKWQSFEQWDRGTRLALRGHAGYFTQAVESADAVKPLHVFYGSCELIAAVSSIEEAGEEAEKHRKRNGIVDPVTRTCLLIERQLARKDAKEESPKTPPPAPSSE
jgi:hypothetical protein